MESSSYIKYFIVAIYLVILLLMLNVFVFDKIVTVFNISAESETLTCDFVIKPLSSVNLHNAEVYNYDSTLLSKFDGRFAINAGTKMYVERIGSGPLLLEFTCGGCSSVGSFYSAAGDRRVLKAADYLYVEIQGIDSLRAIGQSIIVPYTGIVTVGNSVEIELPNTTTPVLRKGVVSMAGISSVGAKPFLAGTEELFLGDMVKFQDSMAIGFVYLDEDPAFKTTFRVQAREGVIIKPGPKTKNAGHHIHATLYDRFTSDSLFQGISLLFGVLLVFISIANFLLNLGVIRKPSLTDERKPINQ